MSFRMPKGWKATRARIYARDGGVCYWCHAPARRDHYDVDHVVPRHQGGGNEDYNLVTSHSGCNRGRTPRTTKGRMPWSTPSRW